MKNDGVEAALDHLRQVDLVAEVLRVVALGGEVGGVDVVVRVERDHPIVNAARLLDERVVRRAFDVCAAGAAERRGEGERRRAARNEGACHPDPPPRIIALLASEARPWDRSPRRGAPGR